MIIVRQHVYALFGALMSTYALADLHRTPTTGPGSRGIASEAIRRPVNEFLVETKKPEPLKKEALDKIAVSLDPEQIDYLAQLPFTDEFSSLGNSTWKKNILSLWGTSLFRELSLGELETFEKLSDKDIQSRIDLLEALKPGDLPDTNVVDLEQLKRRLKRELEVRKEERETADGRLRPREFSEFRQAVHTDPGSPPQPMDGRVPIQPIQIDQEKVLWITFGESICHTGAMEMYRHMANALKDAKHFSVDSLAQLEGLRSTIDDLINNQGYRHVVISGHGSPYGMTIGPYNNNLVPQNAVAFGSIFKGATDIRMVSCELGLANGVLRGVAQGADAAVTGSSEIVYASHNGRAGYVAVPVNGQWISIVPHARRGEAANDKDKAKYLASYQDPTKAPEGVFPKAGGGVEFVNPGSLFRDQGRLGPDGQTRGDRADNNNAGDRARKLIDDMLKNTQKNAGGGDHGSGGGAAGGSGSGGGGSGGGSGSGRPNLSGLGSTGFALPSLAQGGGVNPALLDAYSQAGRRGPRTPVDFSNLGATASETILRIFDALYRTPAAEEPVR